MSIKLMSLVWELPSDSINATQTSILLRMADFAADDGTSIYPGVNTIAESCKLNRETVRDNIKVLVEKQFLILVAEAVPSLRRANTYRMNVDKLRILTEKPLYKKTTGGATPPGGGGATPPGGGGATPPNPSLRSIIENHHHLDAADLDELLKDNNNETLVEEWVKKHGDSSERQMWQKAKLNATNSVVGLMRHLRTNTKPPAKDLAPSRPHETPEETLSKIKPVIVSQEMPDYFKKIVRGNKNEK